MLHRIIWLLLVSTFVLPSFAASPRELLDAPQLEKELKARCLKQSVLGDKISTEVFEQTSKSQGRFKFESIRFAMSMKAVRSSSDCIGERQIVKVSQGGGGNETLYDSKFYDPPYCDEPVRRSGAPFVYEMTEVGESGPKAKHRPLVVLPMESSTLPCPDSAYSNVRRYLFLDGADHYKPLLDVEAEFVVPEIGDSVYRVHIRGAKQVFGGIDPNPSKQLPTEFELVKGKFQIRWSAATKPQTAQVSKPAAERVVLNEIYSKDSTHIYYETADGSGTIAGADVATFQLLSPTGESDYTKDANRVYFLGEPVLGADAASFVQLNDRYGKDLRHVFLMKEIVPDVDVPSFETPYRNVWYGRDKNSVYNSGKKFALADVESFTTGDDRSCGKGCTYRNEDKRYRYDHRDRVVQEFKPGQK